MNAAEQFSLEKFPRLKERGRGHWRGRCEFCGGADTLTLRTADDGIPVYNCFACGEKGNAYTLGFTDEKKENQSEEEKLIATYAKKSGKPWRLTQEILKEFGIKIIEREAKKNKKLYKVFTLNDAAGNLQKVLWPHGARWILPAKTESQSSEAWLNLSRGLSQETVYVCAGEWDMFAFWRHTGLHAISPKFGEQIPRLDALEIFAHKKVVILYDNDTAGRVGASRLLRAIKARVKTKSLKKIDIGQLVARPGADIDDFFEVEKGTAERLFALIEDTPEFSDAAEASEIIEGREIAFPEIEEKYHSLNLQTLKKIWQVANKPKSFRRLKFSEFAESAGVDMSSPAAVSAYARACEEETQTLTKIAFEQELKKIVRDKLHLIATASHESANERTYFCYDSGGFYRLANDEDFLRESEKLLKELLPPEIEIETKFRRLAREKFAACRVSLPTEKVNDEPDLINFKNCLLSFDGGREIIRSHSPKEKTFVQLAVNYDPDASEPKNFLTALEKWFATKEEREEFLKLSYYILSGDRAAQVGAFFHGVGGDGKGEAVKLLREILGADRTSAVSLNDLQSHFMTQVLFGKLLNVSDEVDRRGFLPDGIFKNLTGGSLLTADRKNKEAITFQNRAFILIVSNTLPTSNDSSRGMERRLKVFSFRGISESDKLPNFFENFLRPEIEAIAKYIFTVGRALYLSTGFVEQQNEIESKRAIVGSSGASEYLYAAAEDWFSKVREEKRPPEFFEDGKISFLNFRSYRRDLYFNPEQHFSEYKKFCDANGYKVGNRANFEIAAQNFLESLRTKPHLTGLAAWKNLRVQKMRVRLHDKIRVCYVLVGSEMLDYAEFADAEAAESPRTAPASMATENFDIFDIF